MLFQRAGFGVRRRVKQGALACASFEHFAIVSIEPRCVVAIRVSRRRDRALSLHDTSTQ